MKHSVLLLLTTLSAVALGVSPTWAHSPNATAHNGLDRASFCAITHKPPCSIDIAVKRGLFPTGLRTRFAAGVKCPEIDSERYAIDYTYKRNRPARHGGIDIAAPFGTPIVAATAGTVVGVYRGEHSYRGIQVIVRATPRETGLPIWTYMVYAHLNEMPKLHVGAHVRMGELIGLTGNSGRGRAHKGGHRGGGRGAMVRNGGGRSGHNGGRHRHHGRRPALHFGVYYSTSAKYAALRGIVVPTGAHWMDPVALFRGHPPFDSAALRALPAAEKAVPIPYMLSDGSVSPAGSRIIWPYRCSSR